MEKKPDKTDENRGADTTSQDNPNTTDGTASPENPDSPTAPDSNTGAPTTSSGLETPSPPEKAPTVIDQHENFEESEIRQKPEETIRLRKPEKSIKLVESDKPDGPNDQSDGPQLQLSRGSKPFTKKKIQLPDIEPLPDFISEKRGDKFHRLSKFSLKSTQLEALTYDFAGARSAAKTNGMFEAVGHMIKICLGSGVVTIQEGYRFCGVWTALALNVFLGLCITYCMYILVRSAQKLYGKVRLPTMTYPDVAEACIEVAQFDRLKDYSWCFRFTVDFTITAGLFCSCSVYQIIVAKCVKQLVEGSDVLLDEGQPPLKTYIVILLVPCFLICMITTLKYFAPFTVVMDLLIIFLAATTVYSVAIMAPVNVLDLPAYQSVGGIFKFTGICLFSMDGCGNIMSLENHMAQPKKFPLVLSAMALVVVVVCVIGFFGYWGYGDQVQSPITLNYPWRPVSIMLKVFLALMLYVAFPLNFWMPFELIWHYLKLRHAPAQYWFWERVYRAMFVIIITLVAYALPNVVYFTGLIGSFCSANLAFVYPPIIELFVVWEDPGLGFFKWRLLKCIFFILIGLTLSLGGCYFNGKGLIEEVFFKHENTTAI